jgi:CubicO group peptidase (beta-lactamase class C family)
VLQLVESGSVELGSTLESFVPGFPFGERITVEQLLGHRSGIPSDGYLEGFREKSAQPLTLDEAIDWVRHEARPRFEPGDRFDYSNTGYLLLTSIIEKASGLAFEQYLDDDIFDPAGMSSSGLDSAALILEGRARGCSRTELGDVANSAYRDPSFGWGYGALYSTVLDLWSFDRALVDGRLLSSASRRLMWTARSDTPWGNRYGLGWFLEGLDAREVAVALGSTAGHVATLRHDLASDMVVIALLNQDFMLYQELFDQLWSIALGKPWRSVLEPTSGVAPGPLATLVGTYEMGDGALLELRAVDGRTELGNRDSAIFFEVSPLSDREGYAPEQNARLRFEVSPDGEVGLLALYGNLASTGRRVSHRARGDAVASVWPVLL